MWAVFAASETCCDGPVWSDFLTPRCSNGPYDGRQLPPLQNLIRAFQPEVGDYCSGIPSMPQAANNLATIAARERTPNFA